MRWVLVFFLLFFLPFHLQASKAKLAIIIDDLGYQTMPKKISALPPAISIAIIPFTQFDQAVAKTAKKQNRDVLIHLPMQSIAGADDKHALTLKMNKSQVQSRLRKALHRMPNAIAINNHMGSVFTQHSERMGWVMETLHANRLGFLDSRTSANTVAQKVAQHHGIATNRRHVFLDHKPNAAFIKKQLELAIKKAKKNGVAIMIAHPFPISLDILTKAMPRLQKEVELIPISQALHLQPNALAI